MYLLYTEIGKDRIMKKLFCLLILCMLSTTACSQKENISYNDKKDEIIETDKKIESNEENQSKEIGQKKDSQVNEGAESKEEIESNGETQQKEEINSYYGSFSITLNIHTASIYALSAEEIEQLQKSIIEYKSDSCSINETIYKDISYHEKFETSDEFAQNYKQQLTFSDLGLSDNEVLAVSIESPDNSDFFGSNFYVKDKDTLIILYNGVFFEAVRNLEEN